MSLLGMTFDNPDFVHHAEAYGAKATRVSAAVELAPALETAFADRGVHLVIVPIEYSEYNRVLVDELAQRLPVTTET
jgi:acetolactate synthase-1/2/3 large subunit